MPDRIEQPDGGVPDASANLAEINRDLRRRCHENEAFVDAVAHDLRAPLVNLMGFSNELRMLADELTLELADDRVPTDVRERTVAIVRGEMSQSIGYVQAGVRRMQQIVDALLRLARTGHVVYQRQPVDVVAIIVSVAGSLQATAEARRATIRVGDLPSCWGDPAAVEQIFANLIGNALKYLDPRRRGEIKVGCQPATTAEASADGTLQHTYFVQDNGLGIPFARQDEVFVPFRRLSPDVAPGEGIGLAIVRRIVERLGGRIWLESTPGQGSTFFVSLPAADRQR